MELFERVRLVARQLSGSDSALAEALALRQNTFSYYLSAKTQTKLWELLPKILVLHPQINREWLYFDEGDMLRSAVTLAPAPTNTPTAIPLMGFAGCSTLGWHGSMTFPIAATAPHARPGMIAVMATGESMLPAGIGHGHVCFCDPHAEPVQGECVYVACHDDRHSLKTFLGWGGADGYEASAGELVLRGWLDKQEGQPQNDVIIRINKKLIKVVAPVIYVQRRL